jgi:hypothetical protein
MVVLLALLLCAVIGWKVGDGKGRPVLGLVLGLLLGLIGILIIVLLPNKGPQYPAPQYSGTQQYGALQYSAQPYAPPPVVPAARYLCPSCRGEVLPAANTCPHCRHALRPTALVPPPAGTHAGWLRDPAGRYVDRYWDGFCWTEWVRNEPNTEFLTDPPVPAVG